MKITQKQAVELLKELKARKANVFFRVLFQKKDGSMRWMTCRLEVKAYLKGGQPAYDFAAKGLLNVADVDLMRRLKKGDPDVKSIYRNITLENVKEIKIAGRHFIVGG